MNDRAWKRFVPDAAILLLVLVAYLPALTGGFIWDDDDHLTKNPCIIGPLGFKGIWTSSAAVYYPLVLTSFWIQHALWGLNPFPYHLVNILVHGMCAIVLRRVLLNLNVNRTAAWLGATFWALHPVQTESVAWITELKNTQSGLFYLLAILFFVKWEAHQTAGQSRKRAVHYMLVLLFAAFAMLSKSSTVMLPVVLALCAWWMNRRWGWRVLKVLLPLLAISGAVSGWTIWEQKFHSGALGEEWNQTFLERLVVAGKTIWFYMGKLICPHPLIFIYPRWTVDASNVASFLPVTAGMVLISVLWWFRCRGWAAALFFAFAYFLVSLFPVLDFFNVYFFRYSFVGDHFQYLASIGPLALAGAGIVRLVEVIGLTRARLWQTVCAAIIGLLVVLTSRYARVFRSDERLWRDTMAKNPDAWLAHNNLSTILMMRGDMAGAIEQLEITLRLHPHYAEAHANLANALYEGGQTDEAIAHYRLALEYAPRYGRVHNYLGVALLTKGQTDEAIGHFQTAIEIEPKDAGAHENMAIALVSKQQPAEALIQFRAALSLNPGGINVRMNYGKALMQLGKVAEAVEEFAEVLRVASNHAPAHKSIGGALMKLNKTDESLIHLKEAYRLNPADTQVRQVLEANGVTIEH